MNDERSERLAETLANFCSGLSYEDLSPEVVDWAKYLCLDFAGVSLNGFHNRVGADCVAGHREGGQARAVRRHRDLQASPAGIRRHGQRNSLS